MIKDLIKKNTTAILNNIIKIRRYLHMNPELSFNEYNTSKFIKDELISYGITVKSGIAKTGIIGILNAEKNNSTVALRADMDALPINELSDIYFKSTKKGIMHACGHDIHMSIILGVAKVLSLLKNNIPGSVIFIFQPGEEGFAGAKEMIKEGVLEEPKVDMIVATHISPNFLTGQISVSRGYSMASATEYEITVLGKGGHAAEPKKCINPINVASKIAQEIFKLQSKDTFKKSIVTITSFNSGNTHNIVPTEAKLIGTIRTFDPEINYIIFKKFDYLINNITKNSNTKYKFFYEVNYPTVFNNNRVVDILVKSANEFLDSSNIFDNAKPVMLAEDFSYYTQKIPGAIFHLGCTKKNTPFQNLHSSILNPDENCIEVGINILSNTVFNFFDSL